MQLTNYQQKVTYTIYRNTNITVSIIQCNVQEAQSLRQKLRSHWSMSNTALCGKNDVLSDVNVVRSCKNGCNTACKL